MTSIPQLLDKAKWYKSLSGAGALRPYVFVRPDNRISAPGTRHKLNWFPIEPIYKNPLSLDELHFANAIYYIEERAFGAANMAMPRWVFYDCAIIPGFVAGFALKADHVTPAIKSALGTRIDGLEWVPLSLFIIIPTMAPGQWVAHNLCAINSLLPESERFYGLGFLSKAFGLWYANVQSCCGITQWGNPAIKLHSHYGHLEVMTAYTPLHSHANTLTYRLDVNTESWKQFFSRDPDLDFNHKFECTEFHIDPRFESSMRELHHRIMTGQGPFFLSASEIAAKSLSEPLTIFREKNRHKKDN